MVQTEAEISKIPKGIQFTYLLFVLDRTDEVDPDSTECPSVVGVG